jgi:hypothetical protein
MHIIIHVRGGREILASEVRQERVQRVVLRAKSRENDVRYGRGKWTGRRGACRLVLRACRAFEGCVGVWYWGYTQFDFGLEFSFFSNFYLIMVLVLIVSSHAETRRIPTPLLEMHT